MTWRLEPTKTVRSTMPGTQFGLDSASGSLTSSALGADDHGRPRRGHRGRRSRPRARTRPTRTRQPAPRGVEHLDASSCWRRRGSRRRTGSPGSRRPRAASRSGRSGPRCITAIRSLMLSASSWSWVTKMKVVPTSSCRDFSSSRSWRRIFASSAPSGSSSRRTAGRRTRARARATRCCWPPESWWGRRFGELPELDQLERLPHPPVALAARDLLVAQAEGDVVADRRGAGRGRSSGRPC